MKKDLTRIIFFVSLVVFLLISYFVMNNSTAFIDQNIYEAVIRTFTDDMKHFFTMFTHLGNVIFMTLLTITSLIVIKDKKIGMSLGVILATSSILNHVFKVLFRRERPLGINIITEYGYSFPSGHAMISTMFYGYMAYLICKKVNSLKCNYIVFSLYLTLILMIGLSRIYLGVHYPSDILAGITLGTIALILFIEITGQ